MLCGVTFYSFFISNVNSMIRNTTRNTESLSFKLHQLDDFKQMHPNLDSTLYYGIKQFLQSNYDDRFMKEDD